MSTRNRILVAARTLLQTKGYAATGVADIMAAAQVPKGVFYYHFPQGKLELGVAAIHALTDEVSNLIGSLEQRGLSAARTFSKVADAMADWLTKSDCQEGCLVGALAAESAPDVPALHQACKAAFDTWRSAFAQMITREGVDPLRAQSLASLAVCVLEGGTLLARVDQSPETLRSAAREVVGLIESAMRAVK